MEVAWLLPLFVTSIRREASEVTLMVHGWWEECFHEQSYRSWSVFVGRCAGWQALKGVFHLALTCTSDELPLMLHGTRCSFENLFFHVIERHERDP